MQMIQKHHLLVSCNTISTRIVNNVKEQYSFQKFEIIVRGTRNLLFE